MAEPAPHTHEPVVSTVDGQPHQDRTPPARGRFDDALAIQKAVGNLAFDNALGAAQPLDEPVRRVMEHRFGTDFGDVRVHTGASATRSADTLQANAYTVGNHIVLGDDSVSHVDTLAHELAHVVQQRGGAGGPAQSGTLEADANQAAGAVTAGRPAAVAGRAAPGVARVDKSAQQAAPVPAVAVMYEYVDENGKHQQVSADQLAELRKQAGDRLRGKLRRAKDSAENNRSTHEWFIKKVHGKTESLGDVWNNPQALIGIAVDIRAGVVPPPIAMWDHAIGLATAGEQALADGNLRESARLLEMAASAYQDSVRQWNAYMDAIEEGAKNLVGELEIVRDVSFAIAITAAVIVAAPVVATGVAGLGATGALATGATMLGTGLVGAGAGAGLRAGADAASQKIVEGEVKTGTVWKEAKRGAKEGLVTGLTAGTAAGLGSAAGVSAEGLTFGQQLARRAVVEGGASAVGQATEAVAAGRSAGEVLEAGAIGFGMGAVTAPLGAAGARLSSAGRTRIAKGLEIGGAAVVAGGATVATGGTWREAAKNASIAAASTAGLSGAQAPRKAAKSTAPPAKKAPATAKAATAEPKPAIATKAPAQALEQAPHSSAPETVAMPPESAVPVAGAHTTVPEIPVTPTTALTEHTPAVMIPPTPPVKPVGVPKQQNVVDRRRRRAKTARDRVDEAIAAQIKAQAEVAAVREKLAQAQAGHEQATTDAAQAAEVYAQAKPGAKRAPRSADTAARRDLRDAESAVADARTVVERAEGRLTKAAKRVERESHQAKKRQDELVTSEKHLERVTRSAENPGEAPRQRRDQPFDPKNRRPNLGEFENLPDHGVERHDGLRHDPHARVGVSAKKVRGDLQAQHDALIAELKADKDKAQKLGHVYERIIAEDITRDGGDLRQRSEAGDKLRISDHGVHEFTLEGKLSDGKLDQIWRDLLTPTMGSTQPRDYATVTVPQLSKESGQRLARLAAAYEELTGRRPTITVRETVKE
ncbi:DUF4157 domain-containing protein [Actinocrispum sp. NPDC049592]|uniref:eCIS core domain-containing protein n=1 Tax=Actinocrispum sp. NPDC049592 TaxID=3154835 RepID=UPI003424C451